MSSPYVPWSGLLAAWLSACLTGAEHPETMQSALGDETLHLLTGLEEGPVSLLLGIGGLRRRGAVAAALALPAPGDPVGLSGPADFNAAALEAEEAVVVLGAGLGLVPDQGEDVVTWHAMPAEPPRPLDPAEAATTLRIALAESTKALVDLEVARWQPEIADTLANLHHRPATRLPGGFGPRRVETVERAVLCREIVALAQESDGAAVSAGEMQARRDALEPLDRAARHALVAACSG